MVTSVHGLCVHSAELWSGLMVWHLNVQLNVWRTQVERDCLHLHWYCSQYNSADKPHWWPRIQAHSHEKEKRCFGMAFWLHVIEKNFFLFFFVFFLFFSPGSRKALQILWTPWRTHFCDVWRLDLLRPTFMRMRVGGLLHMFSKQKVSLRRCFCFIVVFVSLFFFVFFSCVCVLGGGRNWLLVKTKKISWRCVSEALSAVNMSTTMSKAGGKAYI